MSIGEVYLQVPLTPSLELTLHGQNGPYILPNMDPYDAFMMPMYPKAPQHPLSRKGVSYMEEMIII